MYYQRRAAVDLVNKKNEERAKFEATLEEKKAELVSALAKQKAELEKQFGAEFDAAIDEGIREVTAKYKVLLQRIRERAWELGWKAALRKVGVPEDDPVLRHPPKFQSSGSAPSTNVVAPSGSDPNLEAPPVVNTAPEACPANLEASPANREALPEVAAAQTEIDCNAEAAAP